MKWTYNAGIFLYGLIVRVAALFNDKAAKFVAGRKHIFTRLSAVTNKQQHIWFHFASLGEFEQGRPVMEKYMALYPEKRLIVTFFSPSGYEIRKNYALAAGVFYLPLDTARNARKFIELVNPEFAVFTKYEFWFHYFNELNKRNIPLYLISAIFRKEQVFFKWYGGFYRRMLHDVSRMFVQNQESLELLRGIGLQQVELSGDTRFDRVREHARSPKAFPEVAAFCQDARIMICGSTWPADERLIAALATHYPDWKFIIAPHEVTASTIQKLTDLFPAAVKFTDLNEAARNAEILIIDTIGMLSSLYQYGDMAYIGGGFGKGIHNTLEAAAYGIPVIFGPKFDKFQEAKDLIDLKAAISVTDEHTSRAAFEELAADEAAGKRAKDYVEAKAGATDQIIDVLLNG